MAHVFFNTLEMWAWVESEYRCGVKQDLKGINNINKYCFIVQENFF